MLHLTPNRLGRTTARTLPGLEEAAPVIGRSIPPDLLVKRRAIRRAMVDARHEKNAIEHILQLPGPMESLHFVIDGRFAPCDLIPAVRRLSHPATIRRLLITTLSYNRDNVFTLLRGMDAGKIGETLIVVSRYFKSVEKPLYEFTETELAKRGGGIASGEIHTKLILMEMTDGNHYTIEGSGNLRSCKSIEQFSLTNDKELHDFHRQWIETYLKERTTYGRRIASGVDNEGDGRGKGITDSELDS